MYSGRKSGTMTDIMVFDNPDFGQIRSLEIDGEPWFVGKDVAVALGYSNTRDALAKHVDQEDKRGSRFATPSGMQEMTIVNESGLYSLIFSSQLPEAKKFKRWVTSEVLPAIRKTGSYSMSGQALAVQQAFEGLSSWMEQLEKRMVKVERETSYSNYYLRLQMRSGYDENWERRQSRNLKAVSEFIGVDTKKVLRDIYSEMECRYGISLDEFCNDYKRVKGVSSCSTLSVISFSLTLREMFDAVIVNIMDICRIEQQDGFVRATSIMQIAAAAAQGHSAMLDSRD